MKRKKRKLNIKRILLLILVLAVLITVCALALFKDTKETKVKKVAKDIDTIEGYDYTLKDNASKYYKSLFKKLKSTLETDPVNENEYAKLVAQMFVADFFNLENKTNKNDVGGKQFVYTKYQSDFENKAMDTMYKTVESNVYGDRNQELPVVSKVTITKVSNEPFKYADKTDENAYVINFDIEYEKDLGYQTRGSLILIHVGDRLEVAAMGDESTLE